MPRFSNCVFCDEGLVYPSEFPTPCQKEKCQLQSEMIFIDDSYIVEYTKQHPKELFDFLVMMTQDCVSQRGTLEPFPMKYLKGGARTNYKRGDYKFRPKITDELVSDTATLYNDKALYIRCHNCINDSEIVEFLGEKLYLLLRFILKSNNTMLNLCFEELNNKFPKQICYVFKVRHSPEDEQNFKKEDTKILYHGCPPKNWHSVLRNGLKNFSGTAMMAHGAAYGAGVYFGPTLVIPRGYSNVIAVCQVKIVNEDKKGRIFVVKDDKRIILRYIVVFDPSRGRVFNGQSNVYLEIEKQISNDFHHGETNPLSSMKSVKKISKEYHNFIKYSSENDIGIRISLPNEDNIRIWNVEFSNFSENELIFSEMKTNKINKIVIEINFETRFSGEMCQYPWMPPSVRVISPIFEQTPETNIVEGGIICCDLFSATKWSPVYAIENLLIQLKTLFYDERIKTVKGRKKYTEGMAKSAYFQVAKQFRWF